MMRSTIVRQEFAVGAFLVGATLGRGASAASRREAAGFAAVAIVGLTATLFLLAALALPAVAAAQNGSASPTVHWPSFRGPQASGIAEGHPAPRPPRARCRAGSRVNPNYRWRPADRGVHLH